MGTLASTSDKSSGVKSVSTPSTPQAESGNFLTESRLSQSLVTESSPVADILCESREDRDVREDNFLGQETPLVSHLCFLWQVSSGKLAKTLQLVDILIQN